MRNNTVVILRAKSQQMRVLTLGEFLEEHSDRFCNANELALFKAILLEHGVYVSDDDASPWKLEVYDQ